MLVDKQRELMSDLLFTVHQHGGDDVAWKPPYKGMCRCEGYGFQAVYSRIGYINQLISWLKILCRLGIVV